MIMLRRRCRTASQLPDGKTYQAPTLDGKLLPLDPFEISRSLAIQPDGDRFLLGADWWTARFQDRYASMLWQPRPITGRAWAVEHFRRRPLHRSQSAVTARSVGFGWRTASNCWRCFRYPMARTGSRGRRKASTPRRPERATSCAGMSTAAGTGPPRRFRSRISRRPFRPEVIRHVLPQMGTPALIGSRLGLEKSGTPCAASPALTFAPGARLHVLAIGISDYGEAARPS